jgi:ribokinase
MGTGPTNLVLKLGSRGAYLATADGERHRIASFPVDAVDTTAAGDCFNGAFATGLALHMPPPEAARFAAAAAALSVTRFGAQPSMPSRAEVERLLEAGH